MLYSFIIAILLTEDKSLETLTPVQRVAVIAIGLALTLLIAMLLLPWAWKQITELLPATATRSAGAQFLLASPSRLFSVLG
jgi:hypothetical protein